MSLIWADLPSGDRGVYDNVTSLMTQGPWAHASDGDSAGLTNDPDPNIGSAGVVWRGSPFSASSHLRKVLPQARNEAGMACRLWLTTIPTEPSSTPMPFTFRNASNDILTHVAVSPTGSLQVRKGGRLGDLLAETSGPVLTANAWTHLSCICNPSDGDISIEREGETILSETGLDMISGNVAQVSYSTYSNNTGGVVYFKDLVIWDTEGTVNTGHPGPVTVYRRKVTADVSSGWSRTAGSSDYGLLDETPPNDTGYIYAGIGLPAPSIMTLQDLPSDIVSIRGVLMLGRQRKSDGGDCKTQLSLSPNGTDWDNGADRAITTAFTYWGDWSELDPATGFPWTPIDFNGATIKVDRTL